MDTDNNSIWKDLDALAMSAYTSNFLVSSSIITMRQYLEESIIPRNEWVLWNGGRHGQFYTPNFQSWPRSIYQWWLLYHPSFFYLPSERTFSKWGQILSERRSPIQPKRMEKILFLNMNQRFLKFFLRKCRDEQVTNGLILFKVCFYFIMFNFSPRTKVSRQEYGVTMSGTWIIHIFSVL